MASFYKLKIKNITRETPSAISMSFTVPTELQNAYQFIAGQYITLKLTLDGKEIRRAYSICSSPDSGELRVAIKAVSNGVFSTFANQNLSEGDVLEVSQPEGNFTLMPVADSQKNYAAFVAGSGITPVFSIVKSVLENEPKSTFVLVYGNKSVEETIFYNQISNLKKEFNNRFFVHYVLSQNQNEADFFGRIDAQVVERVLIEKHKDVVFETYFLCGPEKMIAEVSSTLKKNNVTDNQIKFELFTSSSSENKEAANHSGQTAITVLLDGDSTLFEMNQKETILEASLKKGIDAPYSCQGGVCSSCLARVTSGTAAMKKNSILSDKEIEDGLILTCQAHPTSPEIVIDFDDV